MVVVVVSVVVVVVIMLVMLVVVVQVVGKKRPLQPILTLKWWLGRLLLVEVLIVVGLPNLGVFLVGLVEVLVIEIGL